MKTIQMRRVGIIDLGVAMKFPELSYCNNTCIFIAY